MQRYRMDELWVILGEEKGMVLELALAGLLRRKGLLMKQQPAEKVQGI